MTLEPFLRTALTIVDETRALIRRRVHEGFNARRKADNTFVTDVDLEIEQLVRDRIRHQYPDHGVVGEEFGEDAAQRSHVWVIDPIDGTRSFVAGVPLYGTLIALLIDGVPSIGIIDHPALETRYHAGRGLGAFKNRDRLALTRDAIDPRAQIIGVGERSQFVNAAKDAFFDALIREHPHVRTYCDCFGHGLAAEGALGAMIDPALRIWDYAATQVVVEESGRMFVGAACDADRSRTDVIVGTASVVQWLVEMYRHGVPRSS